MYQIIKTIIKVCYREANYNIRDWSDKVPGSFFCNFTCSFAHAKLRTWLWIRPGINLIINSNKYEILSPIFFLNFKVFQSNKKYLIACNQNFYDICVH